MTDAVKLAREVVATSGDPPWDSPIDTLARAVLDLRSQCAIHEDIHACERDMAEGYAKLQHERDALEAEVERLRGALERRDATLGVAGLLLTDAMASLEGFLDHIGDCWEWVSRDGELNYGCNEMRRLQRRLKKARAALDGEGKDE